MGYNKLDTNIFTKKGKRYTKETKRIHRRNKEILSSY